MFRYLIENAGCGRDDILHSGRSQFTDLVGGKPLGLTIAWINRRQIELDASVPRPDFVLPDIQSLNRVVAVASPGSAPVKRMVQRGKEAQRVIHIRDGKIVP